jgi:hypothetical protein
MTSTSTEVHSPLTQDEKREVQRQDRTAQQATFKDFDSAFANETRGGRYAKSDAAPLIKPLTSGPWSPQPTPGDEPPLNFDVNAVPDLGFPLNKQSVPAPASAPAVETTDERGGDAPTAIPFLSTTKE